jgi:hypothetical protein
MARSSPVLAVAGLALALLGTPACAAAAGPLPPGTLRLDRAVMVDPSGMERPMPAGTLFVPHGWRTQGGIVWSPEFACTHFLGVRWDATSPDGRSVMRWLPPAAWERNNTGNPQPLRAGCTQLPIDDARTFLTRTAALYWPGSRVLDYRARPDLAKFTPPQSRPAAGGGQVVSRSDAGQMLIGMTERGIEMRALLVVSIDFEHTQLPIPGSSDVLQFTNASASPTFAALAPRGQLDLRLAEAVRASFEGNPTWLKRVADHIAKLHIIDLEGQTARQNVWRHTSEQIGQMITEGWKAQQRSADQRALAFSQALRGVQNYTAANGETTELQGGYARAWKLDDGSYLLSSQASFDPRRELGLGAQPLEPQR